MTERIQNEQDQRGQGKSPRGQRSRSYPVLDLREALAVLRRIIAALGTGAHSKDRLAKTLGYTNGSTGLAARKISALVQYGFLMRKKGQLSPTTLAERALSTDQRVEQAALREAFLRPPLFEEVWARYGPEGRVPNVFPDLLVEDYRISEAAKHSVARIFMDCAHVAGFLDEDGCTLLWPSGRSLERKAEDLPDIRDQEIPSPAPEQERPTPVQEAQEPTGQGKKEQTFKLSLSGGMANMAVPESLNTSDVALLRSWVDLLALQAESQRPAKVEPFRRIRSGSRSG